MRKGIQKNLLIFHGNNLNPLPEDVFLLWKRFFERYDEKKIEGYFEICGYENGHYHSDNFDYEFPVSQKYYPFNSTLGISKYYDQLEKKTKIWIAFLTDGEDIDRGYIDYIRNYISVYNRNFVIVEADEWLVKYYEKLKKLRANNPDKWNQIYKITKYHSLENDIRVNNQIVCEMCALREQCYGVFCMLPDDMQTTITIPREEQYKVNLHVLEPCNYRCRHCFAHFDNHKVLPVNAWKHIVDNCSNAIYTHEFNIAGGEPLLYKGLTELSKYINEIGARCSLITNGFLMDEKWIKENAKYYSTIGFSIDSFEIETMLQQGRCTRKQEVLTKERFQQLCLWVKQYNPSCKIKINSVVTALNKNENIAQTIRDLEIPVSRWKVIKMNLFRNEEFDNSDIQISDEEYREFVKMNVGAYEELIEEVNTAEFGIAKYKIENGMEIVIESEVEASYIMVDANGFLVDNSLNDNYTPLINCASEDFLDGFQKLSLDKDLYFSRYR